MKITPTTEDLVNSIFLNTIVEIQSFYAEVTALNNELCRTKGVESGLEELRKVFEEDLKKLEKRLTNE